MSIAPSRSWLQFRLPFVDRSFLLKDPHSSYWQMLGYYFSPYFTFSSASFIIIIITFLCMIIPQIFFPTTGYTHLFQETVLPHLYLTPIEIKHVSHKYIYEAFTSMFFHAGYPHWLSNVAGIILNMATMEFCWFPSLLFMLLGGVVANCYATLTADVVMLGFSGVIACSIGLYVGMFIGNWSYIRRNHSQMMVIWMVSCLFLVFLLVSYSPMSTLIHLIAFGMGVLYGIGWIPKPEPDGSEVTTGMVCKVVSALLSVLPVFLILIHPTGGIQIVERTIRFK